MYRCAGTFMSLFCFRSEGQRSLIIFNTISMACRGVTARHIILTGPPGVGKTTLIRKAVDAINHVGTPTHGFYTQEVRVGGRRIGFDVVDLNGTRGTLARVSDDNSPLPGQQRDYKVGQYSVDLKSFEQTALPTLTLKKASTGTTPVVVIDEVGKMELFSRSFVQSVRELLDQPKTTILATIPVPKGKPIPLVEEIRSRKDATVFMISIDNRDNILQEIVQAVKSSVQSYE